MALLLWPSVSPSLVLLLQLLLLCPGTTQWPCVEQNPPGTHLPLITNTNWLMYRLDLVRLLGYRRPVALSRLLPPVVADSTMLSVFSSAIEERFVLYCVVVAVASASIMTVLLVAEADRAPKWTSDCSMKEAGAPAIWLLGVPAVEEGVIPCTRTEECA